MTASPPRYVYTLSDHEEYGATNMRATLDRARLPALLAQCWSFRGTTSLERAARELGLLLARSDADLATYSEGHRLEIDWGGVMLHVVELDAAAVATF